ncbi:SBBP repeat-containing protein [Paraflavisolibacter sp. H34]|uniref:SBBP repeat-containing protein n=1 Tax=Huijunlia imazamoxiresistens TaxID=3127457 RepID=UPI00301B31E3
MKLGMPQRLCWLLAGFVCLFPALSRAQLRQEWERRYNATVDFSQDGANALALDAAGNVLVTGGMGGSESGMDVVVLKRSREGRLLWRKRYNGPANGNDQGTSITTDTRGNVYVAGISDGGANADILTLKYSPGGTLLWAARYNGPANHHDYAYAIGLDAPGNVYVAGESRPDNFTSDFATLKYDAGGALLWAALYDGPGADVDRANALAVDARGNVYVTGISEGVSSASDYATLKYSPEGGLLWRARYNGTANSFDHANALAVDGAGNVYVTGYSRGAGTFADFATVKYGPAGTEHWVARFNGPESDFDEATALALDAGGAVYVTGLSRDHNNIAEYVTLKYLPDGRPAWTARYNSAARGFRFNIPSALALDAWGNVSVTGVSGVDQDLFSGDYATVQYNSSGVLQWEARYNGTANWWDAPYALAVDGKGNVLVSGESWGSDTGPDLLTLKYNARGGEEWAKREGGSGNGEEKAVALALDPWGNLLVAGAGCRQQDVDGQPVYDMLLVKYRPDGSRSWERRYDGPAGGADEATALATDAGGNVYVAGTSLGQGSATDYALVKYGADGTRRWVARYNGGANGFDGATALAAAPGGGVVVTGYSCTAGSDYDYVTIQYDRNGKQRWLARYGGPGGSYDEAAAVAVDGRGNVYVTGTSYGGSDYDFATVKYNSEGVLQWVARFDGGARFDAAAALVLDAAGNVYVTGTTFDSDHTGDYATVKYDTGGRQLWAVRYNGPGNGQDEATALAVDGAGNVYVTGSSWAPETFDDYATLKYDAAGRLVWAARYNGWGNEWDGARALAVDGQGRVYVTGRSHNGRDADFATVLYDAGGTELWRGRADGAGHGHDDAHSLALDAKGQVYITGESIGKGCGSDFLTIKYRPALRGSSCPYW